nr:hypothetical protein [Tanacetum cinerariifolium]
IRRWRYNLTPAESKFKTPMLDHQYKNMMKAQVHVSKSFEISDVQPLPRRKHFFQIYQMIKHMLRGRFDGNDKVITHNCRSSTTAAVEDVVVAERVPVTVDVTVMRGISLQCIWKRVSPLMKESDLYDVVQVLLETDDNSGFFKSIETYKCIIHGYARQVAEVRIAKALAKSPEDGSSSSSFKLATITLKVITMNIVMELRAMIASMNIK